MYRKISKIWGIIIVTIAVLVGIGVIIYKVYYVSPITPEPIITDPVVCTMEAKICPDGSSVGRTGPNCEFAQCPTISAPKCRENEKYFVISKDSNSSGVSLSDFLVKYKTNKEQKIDCKYVLESSDFELKNQESTYFGLFSLTDNFLLLNSGTGTPHLLKVYDLVGRKEVYTEWLNEEIISADKNVITYWSPINEVATSKNCPDFDKYSANPDSIIIMEARISLNLSTLVKKDLKDRKCYQKISGGIGALTEGAEVNQSAQNAIIAWNEQEESLIFSSDVLSATGGTYLRIIPFPSQPDIKEGDTTTFASLTDLVNKKPLAEDITQDPNNLNRGTISSGVQIVFQKTIGSHDLTTVKAEKFDDFINWIKQFLGNKKLSEKVISRDLESAVANYIKKDIKYFVFDLMEVAKDSKETTKPLTYKFKTEYLYYPLLISGATGVAQNNSKIDLFLITKKQFSLIAFDYSYYNFNDYKLNNVYINKTELGAVSSNLLSLFSGYDDNQIRVIRLQVDKNLKDLKKDLILYPSSYWKSDLFVGNRNDEVKAMQKILINENDLWTSAEGCTGYFDSSTKGVLKSFQARYIPEYLDQRKLESGTGIFGPITRSYLKRISLYQYDN